VELEASGGSLTSIINGQIVAALKNDSGPKTRHFALQLHSGQAMTVEFKELFVSEISVNH